MLDHHEVEPARAAPPPCIGAVFMAALDEQVADGIAVEELARERARTDAGRVRLHDADDALDRPRPHPGTGTHAARDRIARRHVRIGAVVEIEECGLGAFEQHPLLRVERVVDEVDRVVDHRREPRYVREIPVGEFLGVEPEAVVHLREHAVLLAQREVELLAENLRVEQVLHTQADAPGLVAVRRADATLGRAELVLPEVALGDAVELLVVRHDQVRVARYPHQPGVDLLRLEHVELVEEHRGLDHDTVADHRRDPGVQDAAGDELELEHLAVDDDGVARVVPALIADAHRGFLGEVVGEAAFAFVTPLHTDDHCARHQWLPRTFRQTAVTLGRCYSLGAPGTQLGRQTIVAVP